MTKSVLAIGNQTNWRASRPMQPYEFALQNGLGAFEWFSDRGRGGWCDEDMNAEARTKLRDEAAAKGVRFSVHAPFLASPLGPVGAAATRRCLDFASEIGATVVNVHPFLEDGISAFAEALAPLLEHAGKTGVRVSVENLPPTTPEVCNEMFAALLALPEAAGGRVGMCLDMGHANINPATRGDYNAFVDRLDETIPIIHWHAHENWGDRDSHLTLFTGPSATDASRLRGLVQRLMRRGFDGLVILEQWPSPPDLLLLARDGLREMFESVSV